MHHVDVDDVAAGNWAASLAAAGIGVKAGDDAQITASIEWWYGEGPFVAVVGVSITRLRSVAILRVMAMPPEDRVPVRPEQDGTCRRCGGSGYADDGQRRTHCPNCGVTLGPRTRYSVYGTDSADVIKVMREIERQRLSTRSPWRAGLFYLTCLAVVTALALVVARLVDWWILPIVMIVALVSMVVLGALQLRQDGKLTEPGLTSLIGASFRTAKSVLPQAQGTPPPRV